MLDRPLQIMLAQDGTELLRYCWGHLTIMLLSTYLLWGASWLSSSRWDHCFQDSLSKIRWHRFAKCWVHPLVLTGQMALSLRSNSAINFHSLCLPILMWWYKMQARRQYSWYKICYSMILRNDQQLLNACSILSLEYECRSHWTHLIRRSKRSLMKSWMILML